MLAGFFNGSASDVVLSVPCFLTSLSLVDYFGSLDRSRGRLAFGDCMFPYRVISGQVSRLFFCDESSLSRSFDRYFVIFVFIIVLVFTESRSLRFI